MTLLETAMYWVGQGLSVIPLGYRSKRPLVAWEEYQKRLPSQKELVQWFPTNLRNMGLIVGGSLLFLTVIDFDVMDVFNYWDSIFHLDTYMVKTRRGVHVYVTTDQPAKNYHSDLLDIKAERGYVLIPPSIHPSGFQYQIYKSSPILRIDTLANILPAEFTPKPELVSCFDQQNSVKNYSNDPWEAADNALSIDEDLIKKIRLNLPILSILNNAEKSSPDGRWYRALCPFHHDHSPSFWIDTQRGMCGCRKCNIKEMDVCDLYARLHNISNQEAIVELARML